MDFINYTLFTDCFTVTTGASAALRYADECYGRNYRLPFEYTQHVFRNKLYFSPSNGGPRRVVLDKGEAKDPRVKVSVGSVHFTDLRMNDAGVFSISLGDDDALSALHRNVIRLHVVDCSQKVTRYYGDLYSFTIPGLAEFLEYSPLGTVEQMKVLWNRSDSDSDKGGRGQMKRNAWRIPFLTQADIGNYNIRAKDNTLISRTRLDIQEHERYYDAKEYGQLLIRNPSTGSSWSVEFTPREETRRIKLTREGELVPDDSLDTTSLRERIWVVHDGIEINPVQITDTGNYYFKDPQGHLAQIALVSIEREETPTFVYVAVIAGISVGAIILCCCVRRCCCKKSSSKRDTPAPAVYYHDQNQPAGPSHSAAAPAGPSYRAAPAGPSYSAAPAGPSYSAAPAGPSYSAAPVQEYSFQLMHPTVLKEPETTSFGQSVAGPRGQGATAAASLDSNFLSSDPEPTFNLKGVSADAPLSSDSNTSYVYNSDKLNFL